MKNLFQPTALLLVILFASNAALAQFNVDGQILQRTEFRNGFGRLIGESQDPAAFMAHRARIQASYTHDRLSFYMSVQDVRTWGNTPQVKATDPFLSVHEAWAETRITDHLSVKLGRQELNYDNFRFLGNLDWALQGRAHDFALMKYEKNKMKLHFGGGWNQDGQALSGNIFIQPNSGNTFTEPNQYKAAQMVWFENRWDKLHLSLLFWNDGRQFLNFDTLGAIDDKGIRYRTTLGVPTLNYKIGNTTLSAFYYHQMGQDVIGRDLNAFDASFKVVQQAFANEEKGQKLQFAAGFEVISGNATNETTGTNRAYSPLYGTNHIHNGYMDFFFVGGRFENSVGLQDLFVKTRYDFNPKTFLQLEYHNFAAYGAVVGADGTAMDRGLGHEIDLTLGYRFTDAVSVQMGYSQIFASDTFAHLQNVQNPAGVQNWAYVLFIYRPTMKNKFVGLLL